MEDQELESSITDAAQAAEDVIESHIVGQIYSRSTSHCKSNSSTEFHQELDRVIHDLHSIKIVASEMIYHDQKLHRKSAASVLPSSTRQVHTMVGFDEALITQLLDKLTRQQQNLQTISAVGMGGIGKTTLAKTIYKNQLVVQHFDILAWVTISQAYNGPQILLQLLCDDESKGSEMSEDELGERLHKKLWGRRHLIVMDDIWRIEAWHKVKFFLPDNNNGSRIMITTRLSNLIVELNLSSAEAVFQKANLRCLFLEFDLDAVSRFHFSWSIFWNLQIVIVDISWESLIAPFEIWEMALLRYAKLVGFQLPDPPSDEDSFVLEYLHTLSCVENFKCSEEVVKRVPNIKSLKFQYTRFEEEEWLNLCLNNLGHLHNLECLNLYIVFDLTCDQQILMSKNLTFPSSLKKLTLRGTMLEWEELMTKIGSLPFLEYLKLSSDACKGSKWTTVEGQFCNLKFLKITGRQTTPTFLALSNFVFQGYRSWRRFL